MATTNLNVRVDENLKKNAEQLFFELGMNMSTAVNIFLKQAVKTQSIPFPIRRYSPETEAIMAEAAEGKNLRGPFNTVEELWEDLNAED